MDGMYEDMEGMMDENGEMMYGEEDEDMDGHDGMGHHEMMGEGDSYGMEGSPEYDDVIILLIVNQCFFRDKMVQ